MEIVPDDVVISGIGGYFPKALNIEEFKQRLFSNEVLLEARWPEGERGVCNKTGIIPSAYFDNSYFGIHRQQCTFMDPMQRLVMERTFEALIDAGVNPAEIRGRRVGVFIGSAIGENDNLFLESVVSGFGVTGHSRAMMPNRLSYWLNLKGPSVAYDSNWVGGIEVLRLAYSAIKTGQCESVIIGTANLALNSEFQWIYNDMGLLSSDGSTRAFDADASGYGRSDGIVVMYIQRSSEARRSYASVLRAATQFDGNRKGDLLTIDPDNMAEFLEEFYQKCTVKPEEVDLIETYGCALKETDRKELLALEKVYCKNRKAPLQIGSVKTITGHSEASASLFSIVKLIIAMETETIPAHLQFKTPNPDIPALHNGNMEVVTYNKKWDPKYAAVNAIGIDSYYGHALLKANQKKKNLKEWPIPPLIIASTRTQEGIDQLLETVKSKPKDPEYYQLIQDVFAKPILGHLYRGYAVLGQDVKQETEYHMGNKRQIWFVYSGMGSQWCGMLSDFMKIEVFAKSIQNSQRILEKKGVDLMKIITTSDKTIFDNILHCFVGIAAIQIALTDVLRAIGIEPDGIIGHSVGELGCAYADGCMTAEQMILSAYSRGRASIEVSLIKGMMAAIGLGYHQIKDRLPPTVEVACRNGPDSCTISGPTEDMEKFVKQLQDEGVFARLVNVANIAYHSRYIKPAAPLLLKYLKDVLPEPVARSSKWVSTSNMEENWNTDLAKHSSAEYHTNNLLSAVLFEEGCKHIPKDSILIEIAPHGLLQAILKRSVKHSTNIPLTQRGSKSGVDFLLQSLGKMYLAGLDLNVSNLYPKCEYPVSRGTAHLGDLVHWNHSETWRTGLEDKLHALIGVRDLTVSLNSEEFRECVGHKLNDNVVMPTSFFLSIVYQIIANITTARKEIVFDNLLFKKALTIPKVGSVPLHAMVQKGSGEFEILSENEIILTGRMTFPQSDDKFLLDPYPTEVSEDSVHLSGNDVYSELQHRGHKYSGPFKAIKSLTIAERGSVSVVQSDSKWPMLLEALIQQQLLQAGEKTQDVFVPRTIRKIAISETLFSAEKSEVDVAYNYATKIVSTPGLQLINMEMVPLEIEKKATRLDSFEYAPLYNNNFNKIENGINLALQLALTNFDDPNPSSLVITELESDSLLSENIKNVLNEYNNLSANVSLASGVKQIIVQQSYPLLLILNDVAGEDVLKLVALSHAFLLTKTDKALLSQPEIIQVGQFNVNNTSYSILRRVNTSPVSVINVKGDTLSVKDLKRSSVSWATELFSALSEAKTKQKNVFLISSIVPVEGFNNFVQELRSLPDSQSLRIVFNLDKKTGDFSPIFKQNLTLTIIKDGIFHAFVPIAVKFKENIVQDQLTNNIIKNTTVNFISVNLKDETINPALPKRNEVGNIDYSGVTNTGQPVMGLARLDKDNNKLVPDPIFTWDLPDHLTLEDGASIPHAYVSAYYMLMIKARLQHGDTVLIHAGCSPVGLAAISIAQSYGCKVFTTVSEEYQRAHLKKKFSFLRDFDIFSSENSSFEPQIKTATGGRGAEVILNCVSGSLLQNSLACIADYGRFIQYGKYDLEEGNTFGLYCFLRNTSFYAVDLENVFYQAKEVKEDIRKWMIQGLEELVVRPLHREIVADQNIENILSTIKKSSNIGKVLISIDNTLSINKLNVKKPNKFICDSKSSYLIYGGTAENWTDIAEWLVLRGARKIVVSSDSKPQQNHINRRLSLLQAYYGADIITAPNKAYTKDGAAELLSEVYFLGAIQGVFLLPNKSTVSKSSDIKPVQYIDNALRTTAPKALFVNFINSAGGICQVRADAGFSTYNIQWDKDMTIHEAISGLDDILRCKVKNVFIKSDKSTDSKQESSQDLFKKLSQMLPTPPDIIRDQKYASKEPTLVQIVTEGPREIRELAPVFVIPGLAGRKELDEMAMTLLYPTFLAVLPSTPWSIKDMAVAYVEKMREIWPKGPYNIISLSWGGALTIEIARILHRSKASIHLYLIDSAPITIQATTKHLGEDEVEREVNLLSRVLKINDVKVLNDLKQYPNYESRIKKCLENFEGQEKHKNFLREGLVNLKARVEDASGFQPTEELVSGSVHLIRPGDSNKYDNCGLTLFCSQTPQIVLVNGDHLSIIGSTETTDYINKTHQLI
ncbi:fatty acid synthase-like [Anoplophora glabripennis]|uniref:fatty acid synthase-like n=1 Tax=Anoplophora glabripennis TaxID=217634 RepID=UPI0008743F08|nr:fatty acid synthase-like [Anoplophora glabripennis]